MAPGTTTHLPHMIQTSSGWRKSGVFGDCRYLDTDAQWLTGEYVGPHFRFKCAVASSSFYFSIIAANVLNYTRADQRCSNHREESGVHGGGRAEMMCQGQRLAGSLAGTVVLAAAVTPSTSIARPGIGCCCGTRCPASCHVLVFHD